MLNTVSKSLDALHDSYHPYCHRRHRSSDRILQPRATDLGYRFADLVAEYFDRIADLPTASAIRYKNVRCKPMKRFPYLIMFTIHEATHSVNILRVFNTYQEPWG